MSELNINDLPVEILIKVFRCLDGRSMQNAALTCKLWNDIVVSECRWSLKMSFLGSVGHKPSRKYLISGNPKIDVIRTTKRKFRTIAIDNGYWTEDPQIHEIFQIHGLNVVKLCCCGGEIDNIVAFAELLRLTPNLKHVYMSKISLPGVSDDVALGQVLPDLKKLAYLEMNPKNDQRIINCFKQAKLTSIQINDNSYSVHNDPLVQFLLSQEMLTSLTAKVGFKILEELGELHASIPFRLTQLAIMGHQFNSPTFTDLLLRFVQSQAESLKELEMGDNIPSAVYECVFASMRKLNTLTLRIDRMPQDNEFFKRLKENCSVRTMVLLEDMHFPWRGNPYIGDFFKKLPNVRSLTVMCSANNSILVMAQNLSKLESLSIGLINDRCSIGCVRFSNLKMLEIQHLCGKINWNEFTKIHFRLTELTIGSAYTPSFTSDDMDQIATNVDLQTIRLGFGFVADDRFFEIIRAKCTNLEVLDLHKSCVSNRLRENVGIKVLRLCDSIIKKSHVERVSRMVNRSFDEMFS